MSSSCLRDRTWQLLWTLGITAFAGLRGAVKPVGGSVEISGGDEKLEDVLGTFQALVAASLGLQQPGPVSLTLDLEQPIHLVRLVAREPDALG